MAHKLTYWEENKERTIEESKKYSSRVEFRYGSHGAYFVAKKNGWLDDMTWLNRKNVYEDPVDCVYKYYFVSENAVYIGRTIYPELRDKQHRIRENDTVNRFAKEHNVEIPKMEIIEDKLTVVEGANREAYWEGFYKNKGLCVINVQPCGSLGLMSKGKWSKEKCFEESKKYKSRTEFQRNASQAFHLSMKNGWIDEMTWLPKKEFFKKGHWNNIENIINEAKKYKSVTEFQKGCGGAFNSARKYKILNDFTWLFNKKRMPSGYWKSNKELVFEESKKYTTKKEFKNGSQNAYWAAFRYGWLNDMAWLKDGRKKQKT